MSVNITGCVTQLTDVRLYGNIFDYWTTLCRNKMRVTFHVSRHGRVRVDVKGTATAGTKYHLISQRQSTHSTS